MTDPWLPPRALSGLIEQALAHKRSFIVQHGEDSGGSPFVTFRAKWLPDGCDVTTEITMTWHTRATGTYRLFSRMARGYYRDWHTISVARASQLLTGTWRYHVEQFDT